MACKDIPQINIIFMTYIAKQQSYSSWHYKREIEQLTREALPCPTRTESIMVVDDTSSAVAVIGHHAERAQVNGPISVCQRQPWDAWQCIEQRPASVLWWPTVNAGKDGWS